MSEHRAQVVWHRSTESFACEVYNRAHVWRFEHGLEVPASSAPAYFGDAERLDPEQAFVAALSSCHILTFLAIASRNRLIVDAYDDQAIGRLEKNDGGKLAISSVTLNPIITFAPDIAIDEAKLAKPHEDAHANCFIANSVKTKIIVRSTHRSS